MLNDMLTKKETLYCMLCGLSVGDSRRSQLMDALIEKERTGVMAEEILTHLKGQTIKKIEKIFNGDILITLMDGQVIKAAGLEYGGSIDTKLKNTEPLYCAICGLVGCSHSDIKYTMDELYQLKETE